MKQGKVVKITIIAIPIELPKKYPAKIARIEPPGKFNKTLINTITEYIKMKKI
jgi:hypothetical protein